MLQIDVTPYASDALEDAMRLAQTKALNSYTFSDCMSYLNYAWSDIYSRMACIDSGYYSKTVRLTKKLTRLPPFVKNAVHVYAAINQRDYNRIEYRPSSQSDLIAPGTFYISGTDLYCPDAERRSVWLEYVPQPPQIFFTHHNRDPKITEHAYEKVESNPQELISKPIRNLLYGMYQLKAYYKDESDPEAEETEVSLDNWALQDNGTYRPGSAITSWRLVNRVSVNDYIDLTDAFTRESEYGTWDICFVSCVFPYIFISWEHSVTGEHISGFFTRDLEFTWYNPFAFQGINSDVVYTKCTWNDKTGMGVTIQDFNDLIDDEDENSNGMARVKTLGWTPDTKLIYPAPEVYRYLVARLADKFAALNESNVMGVQKELVESEYAFEAFLSKNKASMSRIINVTPFNPSDML